jgi:hypothetical protein
MRVANERELGTGKCYSPIVREDMHATGVLLHAMVSYIYLREC